MYVHGKLPGCQIGRCTTAAGIPLVIAVRAPVQPDAQFKWQKLHKVNRGKNGKTAVVKKMKQNSEIKTAAGSSTFREWNNKQGKIEGKLFQKKRKKRKLIGFSEEPRWSGGRLQTPH